MRKAERNLTVFVSVLALTFICIRASAAAKQGKQEQGARSTKQEVALDFNNYRVKYKVDEVENGKTVNSRAYTLMVRAGTVGTLRIGSRVPYSTARGTATSPIQYQDVGMNIDSGIKQLDENLLVHTKLEMSSVAGKGRDASTEFNPVFGQFQVENNTVVTLGKPEFVGSADDVSSNRHYVIEVTVTKAK